MFYKKEEGDLIYSLFSALFIGVFQAWKPEPFKVKDT